MFVRNSMPSGQALERLVARGAVSLVEEHSISRCLSTDAFCLVYRICSLVHSARVRAFVVLLTQRRAPRSEVQDISSIELAQSGYHLRVTDDAQPTWLPNISRKDFIQNVPRGAYSTLSPAFNQLPPGTEVVVLPYFVLLVLDREDAEAQRFTPRPDQTGHVVWPPVYFSKGLNLQGR